MRYFIQKPLFFVALLCLSLAACESIDDQSSINNRPTYLPIQDQVAAHPLGDELYIAYTADTTWNIVIDGDEDWVEADIPKSDRHGTENIIFTVKPNLSSEKDYRECTVKFIMGDDTNGETLNEFTIIQTKAVIDIKDESIEMGWKKHLDSLSIESTIQWTIKCEETDDFWFDFEQEATKGVEKPGLKDNDGSGTGKFRYELESEKIKYRTQNNNLDTSDKEVKLTITPYRKDVQGNDQELDPSIVEALTRTIKISQDYLIFMVNDSREEVDLGSFSELGSEYVDDSEKIDENEHICRREIKLTSELGWEKIGSNIAELRKNYGVTLENLPDPTTTEIEGRAVNVYNLRLSMTKPNPSLEREDYTLRFFTVDDEDAYREVRFSQDPYIFDFIQLDQSIDSLKAVNAGDTLAFRIETTGPWKIDEATVPEWMSFDPTEGEGTKEIQAVVPDKNMSFENLDRAVRFTTNSFNDAVEKNLIAHQDRFRFDLKDIDEDMGKAWSRMNTSAHEFTLVSDGAWTLYLDDDSDEVVEWLNIVATTDGSEPIAMGKDHRISGAAGTWTFSVNANSFNNETDDRTKAIRLTSDLHKEADNDFWPDRAIHRYDIKQEKYVFKIMHDGTDISTTNTTIGGEAASAYNPGSYEIKMNCGAPWRITDYPGWVSFDEADLSGVGYKTIKMTVGNNVGENWRDSREGDIKVRSYKEYEEVPDDSNASGEDKSFHIDQDGFTFEVSLNDEKISEEGENIPCDALNNTSYKINIKTVDSAGWSITSDSTWVVPNNKISGNGSLEQPIDIKPGYNGTLDNRDGVVTIKSTALGDNSPTYKVTFNQEAYVFDVESEESYTFETLKGDGQAKTVKIKCTGDWEITGDPTWIKLSEDSGRGNRDITVSVDSTNTSLIARPVSIITVTSTVDGYDPHTHEFKVSQDPYEFSVELPKETTKSALSEFAGTITVTSSGPINATKTTDEDQIDLLGNDLIADSPNRVVSYKMANNYSTKDVVNKFRIFSENDEDNLYKEVTLTREAYIFKSSSLKDGEVITCGAAKDLKRGPFNFKSTGGFLNMDISYDGTEKDWLKDSEFDVSKGTLTIEAAENKGANPRSATIIIKSNDYNESDAIKKELMFKITVGQDGTKSNY